MRGVDRNVVVARRVVCRFDVPAWLVDVDADEIEWRGDRVRLCVGELRRNTSRLGEVPVRLAPFEHHGQEAGAVLTRRLLRRKDTLWRVDDRQRNADVLGEADLRATGPAGALVKGRFTAVADGITPKRDAVASTGSTGLIVSGSLRRGGTPQDRRTGTGACGGRSPAPDPRLTSSCEDRPRRCSAGSSATCVTLVAG